MALADDDLVQRQRRRRLRACLALSRVGGEVLPRTDALPRPAVASSGFRAVGGHGSRRLGRAGVSRASVGPEIGPAVYDLRLLKEAVPNPSVDSFRRDAPAFRETTLWLPHGGTFNAHVHFPPHT